MLCSYEILRVLFVIITLFSFICKTSAYFYNEDEYYHQNYNFNDFTLLTTVNENHKKCWQNGDSNKIVKKRDSDHENRSPDAVTNLSSNKEIIIDSGNEIDTNIIPNDLYNTEEKTQEEEPQYQAYTKFIDTLKPTRRFNNYSDDQDRDSFENELKEKEKERERVLEGIFPIDALGFETPQYIKPSNNLHEYYYTAHKPIRTQEYGKYEGNYLKKSSQDIETTAVKPSRSTELNDYNLRAGKGRNIQPTLELFTGFRTKYFSKTSRSRKYNRKSRSTGYDRKTMTRKAQLRGFQTEYFLKPSRSTEYKTFKPTKTSLTTLNDIKSSDPSEISINFGEYHIFETKRTTSDYETGEENYQNTTPTNYLNNYESLKRTLKIGNSSLVTEKTQFRDFKTEYFLKPTRSAENKRKNIPTRSVLRTIKSLKPSKISMNFDGEYHVFETEKATPDYDTEEKNYEYITPTTHLVNNHVMNTNNPEKYTITSDTMITGQNGKQFSAFNTKYSPKPTRSNEYKTYKPTKTSSTTLKTIESFKPSKVSINFGDGEYHVFETERSRRTFDYDTEEENYENTTAINFLVNNYAMNANNQKINQITSKSIKSSVTEKRKKQLKGFKNKYFLKPSQNPEYQPANTPSTLFKTMKSIIPTINFDNGEYGTKTKNYENTTPKSNNVLSRNQKTYYKDNYERTYQIGKTSVVTEQKKDQHTGMQTNHFQKSSRTNKYKTYEPTKTPSAMFQAVDPGKISINFDNGEYHVFETERSRTAFDYDTEEENHEISSKTENTSTITEKEKHQFEGLQTASSPKPTRSKGKTIPTRSVLRTIKPFEANKISINFDNGEYHVFETERSRTAFDYDTEEENHEISSKTENTSTITEKEKHQFKGLQTASMPKPTRSKGKNMPTRSVLRTIKTFEPDKISINFDNGEYHVLETERSRTALDYNTEEENYEITSKTENTPTITEKEKHPFRGLQTASSPKPTRSKGKNMPTRSVLRTIKPFEANKISINFDNGEYHVFETERSRTAFDYDTEEENYENTTPTTYLEELSISQSADKNKDYEKTYIKGNTSSIANNTKTTIMPFKGFQTHQSYKPSRSTDNNRKNSPTRSVFRTAEALASRKETITFETEEYNLVNEKITEKYDNKDKNYQTKTPSMYMDGNYIFSQSTDNYDNYNDIITNIKASTRICETEEVRSNSSRSPNFLNNTDVMKHNIPSDVSVTKNVVNTKKLKTLAYNKDDNNIYVITTIPDLKTDPEFTQEYIDLNSSTATKHRGLESTTKKQKHLKFIFNKTNKNIKIGSKYHIKAKSKTNMKADSKEEEKKSVFNLKSFRNNLNKKPKNKRVFIITTEEYEDYQSTTSFYDLIKALKEIDELNLLKEALLNPRRRNKLKKKPLRQRQKKKKKKKKFDNPLGDYSGFTGFTEVYYYDDDTTTTTSKKATKKKYNKNSTEDIFVDSTLETTTIVPTTLPLCRPKTTTPITTTTYTPSTTTTTKPPTPPKFDLAALMELIGNLTYDYETNLTAQINESLQRFSIPTCRSHVSSTPRSETPPTSTTTEPPFYRGPSTGFGIIVSKCFVCGLEDPGIPMTAHCADAFAGDFLPLVPVDPTARGHISKFRRYCRFKDIPGYHQNSSDPRSLYGRWTGGCSVRWIDLSGVYTQRTCRNRYKATLGKSFASKRMAKLEMALSGVDNGCIASPSASLVPLSRGISLFARFHACVCSGHWCNGVNVIEAPIALIFGTMLLNLFHKLSVDAEQDVFSA